MDTAALLNIISPIRPKAVQLMPKALSVVPGLRGGTQPVGSLLNQLKGRPGVKAADLALFSHLDQAEKLSPLQLVGRAKAPKHYAQMGATSKNADDEDMILELASDLWHGPRMVAQRHDAMRNALSGFEHMPEVSALLRKQNWTPREEAAASQAMYNTSGQSIEDLMYNGDWAIDALDMARDQLSRTARSFEPMYSEYQRSPLSREIEGLGGEYFETVLRGGPQTHKQQRAVDTVGYHFGNPSQLGHIRGTVHPEGRYMILDEVQSDPVEALGAKHPAMQSVYSKLGQMAIDRAAAAGIPSVYFPTGITIGSTRGREAQPFYNKLYDDILVKEVLRPMQQRGAKVTGLDGWRAHENDDFYTMTLSPELMEAIRRGEGLPGYKRGGLAQMRK